MSSPELARAKTFGGGADPDPSLVLGSQPHFIIIVPLMSGGRGVFRFVFFSRSFNLVLSFPPDSRAASAAST